MTEVQPKVGVGVFIFKDGQFLVQLRQGSHGAGSWAVPGGHLEFGEAFEATARREVKEETGLEIKNVRFGAVTNDYFADEHKHYVTIWVLSDWASGQAAIREPGKCQAQRWVDFSNLPEPLFLPFINLLDGQFLEEIKCQLDKSNQTGGQL